MKHLGLRRNGKNELHKVNEGTGKDWTSPHCLHCCNYRSLQCCQYPWSYRWGLWPHHITYIAVITGHWKADYIIQKEIAERISWSKWIHRRVGVNECTERFGTRSHHLTLLQIMVTADMASTWNSHTKKELQKAHLWEWRYTMWKVQWKKCCFSRIRFTVECLKTRPLESIFNCKGAFFRLMWSCIGQ